MYSKEDKERILADLGASGLSMTAFCQLPGNPTRHCIRNWRLQVDAGNLDVPKRHVPGRCEHMLHSRYPKATKREALSLRNKGMRWCDIARKLNVSSGTVVASWAKASQRAKMDALEGAAMDNKKKDTSNLTRAELEAQVAESEMENAVLRELMRNPKAGDPEKLSNRQKAELGEKLRRDFGYSLHAIIDFLKMPKSTYEYNKKRNAKRVIEDARIACRVRSAFEASGRIYGYRRVYASVRSGTDGGAPEDISELQVRRAMRAGHMVARRTRKKLEYNSYAGEPDERPANVPLREGGTHDFFAPAPNRLAVTDVTEFKVGGTKVYLSPIVDCFDGMPTSWSIALHPDSKLCDLSLRTYLSKLPKNHPPTTLHSDGGCQYRARSWKRICAEGGIVRSMSRKGCCPDNARAEGFFGALKEEFYHGHDWSTTSPERFIEKLDAYIRWYRDGRLKGFREGGRVVYDTIAGRRKRLGYAV